MEMRGEDQRKTRTRPVGRQINQDSRTSCELDREGIECEAGQRHAYIVVKQMGLERSKGASTPGVKMTAEEVDNMEEEEVLEGKRTEYRALVARSSYLSRERLDIMYSVKGA